MLAPPAQPEGANMADIAELHARALQSTGAIVAGTPPDRWHDSTPCQGWDVHTLVNHVVSGNLWAAELAAGATIDDVGGRLDGDLLGSDPALSYAESAKSAAAAFRRPGGRDGTGHHPRRGPLGGLPEDPRTTASSLPGGGGVQRGDRCAARRERTDKV